MPTRLEALYYGPGATTKAIVSTGASPIPAPSGRGSSSPSGEARFLLGAAARRSRAPRTAHDAHLAAASAAAEETVAAVGFRPDTALPAGMSSSSSTLPVCGSIRRNSLWSPSQVPCHSSPSTQVTPVTKRLDRWCAGSRRSRVDLVDLALAVLAHPQRALGPGQARIAAAAGGGDGVEHAAGPGVDLQDAVLEDLVEVLAVECGARMRSDVDGKSSNGFKIWSSAALT